MGGDEKGVDQGQGGGQKKKKERERGMKGKPGRTGEERGRGKSRREKTGSPGVSERRWTRGECWGPRGRQQKGGVGRELCAAPPSSAQSLTSAGFRASCHFLCWLLGTILWLSPLPLEKGVMVGPRRGRGRHSDTGRLWGMSLEERMEIRIACSP